MTLGVMSDNEANKLVESLKEWALNHDKTQYQIAQLLGVDRQRVSKWFSGKSIPSLEHGLKIQKFLIGKRKQS
jgi:transcriptional regulator with XRE-family HTH domain